MQAHKNNVGLLRLIFAGMVIIGHAFEMVAGNTEREPLYSLFHVETLGGVAVEGFFLLSGFLIAKSVARSASVWTYMWRRVWRIYPAFILAYLLCVVVLAPAVGAKPWEHLAETLANLATLNQPPAYPGQLTGLHYPLLNGSMWTIAYEFRCYLMIAALGATSLLTKRRLVLGLTFFTVLGMLLTQFSIIHDHVQQFGDHPKLAFFIQSPFDSLRLTAFFLVGASFFLFWDEIAPRLTGRVAALCLGATVALMLVPHAGLTGLATFGAAALFWLALKADLGPLQKINDEWDISYGVYLYGWPIATAILWWNRGVDPLVLGPLTLVLAIVCGVISWFGLERWTKGLPAPFARRRAIAA